MRIAAYVRVSTDEQNTELQERDILAYCTSRGWAAPGLYRDKATGTNGKRPELQRMLQDARDGKVDVIVCWKLDRLFRSLHDLLNTLTELDKLGVKFVCIKDQIDLATPVGRLMMQLLGAFAEFEAALIRERVKAGMRNARERGTRMGAPTRLDRAEIRRLSGEGKAPASIATALGCSVSGVRKVLYG